MTGKETEGKDRRSIIEGNQEWDRHKEDINRERGKGERKGRYWRRVGGEEIKGT